MGFSFICDSHSTDSVDWLGANDISQLFASFISSPNGAEALCWLDVSIIVCLYDANDIS